MPSRSADTKGHPHASEDAIPKIAQTSAVVPEDQPSDESIRSLITNAEASVCESLRSHPTCKQMQADLKANLYRNTSKVVCHLHGKMRNRHSMIDKGAEGFVCKVGHECDNLTNNDSKQDCKILWMRNEQMRHVIGKGGSMIEKFRKESGAVFTQSGGFEQQWGSIAVYGTPHQIASAETLLRQFLKDRQMPLAANADAAAEDVQESNAVDIPTEWLKLFIGPKGAKLKTLRQEAREGGAPNFDVKILTQEGETSQILVYGDCVGFTKTLVQSKIDEIKELVENPKNNSLLRATSCRDARKLRVHRRFLELVRLAGQYDRMEATIATEDSEELQTKLESRRREMLRMWGSISQQGQYLFVKPPDMPESDTEYWTEVWQRTKVPCQSELQVIVEKLTSSIADVIERGKTAKQQISQSKRSKKEAWQRICMALHDKDTERAIFSCTVVQTPNSGMVSSCKNAMLKMCDKHGYIMKKDFLAIASQLDCESMEFLWGASERSGGLQEFISVHANKELEFCEGTGESFWIQRKGCDFNPNMIEQRQALEPQLKQQFRIDGQVECMNGSTFECLGRGKFRPRFVYQREQGPQSDNNPPAEHCKQGSNTSREQEIFGEMHTEDNIRSHSAYVTTRRAKPSSSEKVPPWRKNLGEASRGKRQKLSGDCESGFETFDKVVAGGREPIYYQASSGSRDACVVNEDPTEDIDSGSDAMTSGSARSDCNTEDKREAEIRNRVEAFKSLHDGSVLSAAKLKAIRRQLREAGMTAEQAKKATKEARSRLKRDTKSFHLWKGKRLRRHKSPQKVDPSWASFSEPDSPSYEERGGHNAAGSMDVTELRPSSHDSISPGHDHHSHSDGLSDDQDIPPWRRKINSSKRPPPLPPTSKRPALMPPTSKSLPSRYVPVAALAARGPPASTRPPVIAKLAASKAGVTRCPPKHLRNTSVRASSHGSTSAFIAKPSGKVHKPASELSRPPAILERHNSAHRRSNDDASSYARLLDLKRQEARSNNDASSYARLLDLKRQEARGHGDHHPAQSPQRPAPKAPAARASSRGEDDRPTCRYCSGVIISGARFCSTCGSSVSIPSTGAPRVGVLYRPSLQPRVHQTNTASIYAPLRRR